MECTTNAEKRSKLQPSGDKVFIGHFEEGGDRMHVDIVHGDLLNQDTDAIVNPWNRNILPWWLLLPQGVAGAIRRAAGLAPFRELWTHGVISAGEAVFTEAGKLPFLGIIHVAGINLFWFATERTIRLSVRNAMFLAEKHGLKSLAFPLIGSGTGGISKEKSLKIMLDEFANITSSVFVRVVLFRKSG